MPLYTYERTFFWLPAAADLPHEASATRPQIKESENVTAPPAQHVCVRYAPTQNKKECRIQRAHKQYVVVPTLALRTRASAKGCSPELSACELTLCARAKKQETRTPRNTSGGGGRGSFPKDDRVDMAAALPPTIHHTWYTNTTTRRTFTRLLGVVCFLRQPVAIRRGFRTDRRGAYVAPRRRFR